MPQISGPLLALTLPGHPSPLDHEAANECEPPRNRPHPRGYVPFTQPCPVSRSRHSPSFAPFAVQTSVRAIRRPSRRSRSKRPFAPLALKPKQIALQLILEGRHFGFAALAPAGLVEGVPEGVEGADLDEKPFVGLQGRSEKMRDSLATLARMDYLRYPRLPQRAGVPYAGTQHTGH